MIGFENEVAVALETIRYERAIYRNYLSQEAIIAGQQIIQAVKGVRDDIVDYVIELCKKETPYESPYMAVYWYSVILKMKKNPDVFQELVKYIRKNKDVFSKNTQDFLYYQLSYMYDANPSLYNSETKLELWRFYLEIVEGFLSEVTVSLDEIPEEQRNDNLVLVIMIQFIEYGHAPTITALDRCRILCEKMGKQVLLINTGEAVNIVGKIPMIDTLCGNNMNLCEQKMIDWQGACFPYYQCEQAMPDVNIINQILEDVRTLAPKRVIQISGSSILGNLINKMIPVLTISTGFSDLAITGTRYQAVGRKVNDEDKWILEQLGFKNEHIIESTFTFDIKSQMEKISRIDLGIQEDVFVLAVVSTRLDVEISDEFLQMLENVMMEKMYVVFLGDYSTYNGRMEKFPILKQRSKSLGFCNDVLSRLEVCDLYINPKRKGGGSSVVEAMYLQKPVVSISYGDVAINAGEEFCVDDYTEMAEIIMKYFNDRQYYEEMAQKAKNKADVLLDTETAFKNIIAEYDKREMERKDMNQ